MLRRMTKVNTFDVDVYALAKAVNIGIRTNKDQIHSSRIQHVMVKNIFIVSSYLRTDAVPRSGFVWLELVMLRLDVPFLRCNIPEHT